jgi:Tol biopolymer transport system component
MSAPFRTISCLVLLIALLAGCGSGASIPAPPSASKAVTDLKVTDQRELTVKNARILSLSPDGKWLVALRDKRVCVVAVDTLTDKQCVDTQTGAPDRRSFVWSLDSKRLVFTEDLPRFMLESDIWVLDVESGQLTDLTPDNVTGGFLKLPEGSVPLLDIMPGWSPDGQTVIFSRSDRDAGSTILERVSIKGGAAEKVLEAADQGPFALWYSPRWLRNGKLVYTIVYPKLTEPANGIWLADSDGKNARQLLGPDPQLGVPMLVDVSAKGDRALILYTAAMQYATNPNVSYLELLELSSGQHEPLKPAGEFVSLSNARFSPDGSKIAYVHRTLDNQASLVIRDVQSGAENAILTQPGILGASTESPMQGLDWVNNDTLYAATGPAGGTLLTLGSK